MKKIIGMCLFGMALTGCALGSVAMNAANGQKPTSSEVQQATCSDAVDAANLASIVIPLATSAAETDYWNKWLAGAQKGILEKCGGSAPVQEAK